MGPWGQTYRDRDQVQTQVRTMLLMLPNLNHYLFLNLTNMTNPFLSLDKDRFLNLNLKVSLEKRTKANQSD